MFELTFFWIILNMYRTFFIATLLMLACLTPSGTVFAQGPPDGKGGPPPAKVAVDVASRETVRDGVTPIGTVEAFQSSTVAALVEGRAKRLLARTGDVVTEGQPLAELDATIISSQLSEARAQAEAARVRLAQAEADLKLAEALLPQQAVSTDLVATRNRSVLETRQELARHEAEVTRLAYLVEQSTIRTPFAGVVAAELIQAGEWVPEGGGIARVVDLAPARVRVWVPEHIVQKIARGDDAGVDTEAGKVTGTVHAITPEGDPKSRTFPVEVRVENADGRLFAGMLARVTFAVGPPEEAITVPKDAVVTRGESSHVWKVDDGKALRVPVRMGRAAGSRVEITTMGTPLAPGDQVVTRGNERVRDGQSLAVTN
ncbi:MAG: efflux RND transporter periplasmic adaptor subunit [Leptospirillia bacterium]